MCFIELDGDRTEPVEKLSSLVVLMLMRCKDILITRHTSLESVYDSDETRSQLACIGSIRKPIVRKAASVQLHA